MDQIVTTLAIKNAVQFVLGFAWQWTRAPKHVPNWFSYAVFLVITVFCWVWMTRTAVSDFQTDWRGALAYAVLGIVDMYTACRGAASMAKDSKAAPAANTITMTNGGNK